MGSFFIKLPFFAGYRSYDQNMNRKHINRLLTILMILIGIFLILLFSLWLMNGGWSINKASGEKVPINIRKVVPYDGELVTSPHGYCLNFDFRAGNGMGDNPVKSVRFFYDGIDVTQQTNGLITLDIPPSGGSLCYKPDAQLSEGWHTAKVTYTDVTGESFSYLWRFQVAK